MYRVVFNIDFDQLLEEETLETLETFESIEHAHSWAHSWLESGEKYRIIDCETMQYVGTYTVRGTH